MLTSADRSFTIRRVTQRRRAAEDAAFQDLRERWLASQVSANTRAAYAIDLTKFGQWCSSQRTMPLVVDAQTIAMFQAAQAAGGSSVATQRRRWAALSSFFQFAVDAGELESNPAGVGQRPQLPAGGTSTTVILSPAAVDAYLASAEALDARLDALMSLLVFDGLKLGEALALDVGDVRGRPPNITVFVRRRGGDKRVQLEPRSAGAVYRCVNRRTNEPLFTGPRRGGVAHRLTRFGADHLLKKLNTTGDVLTTNALRRFHVTSRHDSGTALDMVRDGAGLDDVRTVRRYLRPDQSSTDPGATTDPTDARP